MHLTKKQNKNNKQKKTHAKPAPFSEFELCETLLDAVKKAGFVKPTPVQREVIPAVLSGADVLARAKTGSGKTAAFVLPLLQNLINQEQNSRRLKSLEKNIKKSGNVKIIVLVPTRELAIQIREEFERFAACFREQLSDGLYKGKTPEKPHIMKPLRCLSVYGGVKINPQMIALRGGADVLVGTPGRLLDLAAQNAIRLQSVKALVVDEVDRLMKGDFEEEINQLFKRLSKKRQNLMFTATFPENIRKLVRRIMNEPEIINIDDGEFTLSIPARTATKDNDEAAILQRVITVNHNRKNDLLAHLLTQNDWKQVLIFCSAKRSCDNLAAKLAKRGIEASAMHGNLQQNARARALREFKQGKIRILIATDVAGRGVDVQQLPCIINYELPRSPNDYIHRIGRTARAGASGEAISLISHHEYAHFKVIEKRNGIQLEREQVRGFEADVEAPTPPVSDKPGKKSKKKKTKRKATTRKKELGRKQKEMQQQSRLARKPAKSAKRKQTAKTAVNAHIWGKPDTQGKTN